LPDGNSLPRSSWQGEWPRAILQRRAKLVAAGISEGGVGAERLRDCNGWVRKQFLFFLIFAKSVRVN